MNCARTGWGVVSLTTGTRRYFPLIPPVTGRTSSRCNVNLDELKELALILQRAVIIIKPAAEIKREKPKEEPEKENNSAEKLTG